MIRSFLVILLLSGVHCCFAARVDTVVIYSAAMNKSFSCVVVVPDGEKTRAFPTVYLLHGHGGSFSNWISRVPRLRQYAEEFQVMIVCPEGAYSSWYFDSPVDSTMRFETYVAKEVPAFIDKHYNTIKARRGRAITGLSMGGHGGLFLGFRHAAFFGACGSMSGALLIEPFTKGYDVEKRLGDTLHHRKSYHDLSIMNVMEQYPRDSVAIIIDCGVDDFIIGMSRAVHAKMLSLKIPHEYTERPGKHDWAYWGTAIVYQLFYFRRYFDRQTGL